jgi:hypothetical protein
MLKKEEDILYEYITENLIKRYIRELVLPIRHGVLFVLKKNGILRVYIDYRKLNAIIRKNRYPLLRINELQDRLVGVK